MGKKECIQVLKNSASCFDVSPSDITYLDSLSALEIIDDNNLFYTTPLLSKMTAYSLIFMFLELDYISGLDVHIDDQLYSRLYDISMACDEFLANLYDNNCKHPSVLRFNSISEGVAAYEILIQYLDDLKNELNEIEHVNVIREFESDVCKKIGRLDDDYTLELLSVTKTATDFKDFAEKISNYAFLFAMRRLLLTDRNDVVTYSYLAPYGASRLTRRTGFDSSMALSSLVEKLDKMRRDSRERDCFPYLDNVSEEYNYYKGYQYSYIRNASRENKILEYLKLNNK